MDLLPPALLQAQEFAGIIEGAFLLWALLVFLVIFVWWGIGRWAWSQGRQVRALEQINWSLQRLVHITEQRQSGARGQTQSERVGPRPAEARVWEPPRPAPAEQPAGQPTRREAPQAERTAWEQWADRWRAMPLSHRIGWLATAILGATAFALLVVIFSIALS